MRSKIIIILIFVTMLLASCGFNEMLESSIGNEEEYEKDESSISEESEYFVQNSSDISEESGSEPEYVSAVSPIPFLEDVSGDYDSYTAKVIENNGTNIVKYQEQIYYFNNGYSPELKQYHKSLDVYNIENEKLEFNLNSPIINDEMYQVYTYMEDMFFYGDYFFITSAYGKDYSDVCTYRVKVLTGETFKAFEGKALYLNEDNSTILYWNDNKLGQYNILSNSVKYIEEFDDQRLGYVHENYIYTTEYEEEDRNVSINQIDALTGERKKIITEEMLGEPEELGATRKYISDYFIDNGYLYYAYGSLQGTGHYFWGDIRRCNLSTLETEIISISSPDNEIASSNFYIINENLYYYKNTHPQFSDSIVAVSLSKNSLMDVSDVYSIVSYDNHYMYYITSDENLNWKNALVLARKNIFTSKKEVLWNFHDDFIHEFDIMINLNEAGPNISVIDFTIIDDIIYCKVNLYGYTGFGSWRDEFLGSVTYIIPLSDVGTAKKHNYISMPSELEKSYEN